MNICLIQLMKDYFLIWTGSEDHEISLWNKENLNKENLNCDFLLKVNKPYSLFPKFEIKKGVYKKVTIILTNI